MRKLTTLIAAASLAQLLTIASAGAEIVVIVNNKNPVNSLNADQVEKLFLGKSSAFPDGAAAIPVDLPKGAEREQFYQKSTGKSPSQLRAYWSKQIFTGSGQPPKEAESVQEMVNLVGRNPNLIGYVDKAAVNNTVKPVFTLP